MEIMSKHLMKNLEVWIKHVSNNISKYMKFWAKVIWQLSSVPGYINYFCVTKKLTWFVSSIFKTTILCHHRILGLKRLINSGYPLPVFKRGPIKPFHSGENGFSSRCSLFLHRIENGHMLWIHIKSCVKNTLAYYMKDARYREHFAPFSIISLEDILFSTRLLNDLLHFIIVLWSSSFSMNDAFY